MTRRVAVIGGAAKPEKRTFKPEHVGLMDRCFRSVKAVVRPDGENCISCRDAVSVVYLVQGAVRPCCANNDILHALDEGHVPGDA
jgi:hypothetical protein